MKKTHKVVMLPTEKANDCLYTSSNKLSYHKGYLTQDYLKNSLNGNSYHLYILSDEEIKEGDYGMGYAVGIKGKGAGHYIFYHDGSSAAKLNVIAEGSKKIVATTDKSLTLKSECTCTESEAIYCGESKSIGKCQQLLPQIPESFIQAYIKAYNEGNPITEVDLEIENYGYCDACRRAGMWHCAHADSCGNAEVLQRIKTRPDNTVIVHQSKMYSKDEVIQQLNVCLNNLLCTAYNDEKQRSYINDLIRYPNSNKIGEFVNNWSKNNL